MGSPEGLYQVFEVLKPLPLVQVKKDSADLTAIFLKLVQSTAKGFTMTNNQ
jgi:ABC-2 type transport system ATP-binding protein